jgi:glycosyltransferase involved in cell wall biosynthesis
MEQKRKEVLIIIPAYNEAKTIEPVLDALQSPPISDVCDVLVMNDASKDGTQYICKRRGIPVITHVYNLGYGSGLQVGYKYAFRRGYDYVIQMDADGQHDPSNVLKIYDALKTKDEKGGYPDIVIGSRFVDGAIAFPVPISKKIAFVLFRTLIKWATGQKIMDPTSGLQGLSKRTFWYYSRYSHFDDKYPDANMLMQMKMLGYNVKEIPSVMYARTEGTSMHSGLIKPMVYMFRMAFSIIAVWARVRIYGMDKGAINEQAIIEDLQKSVF